jgi:hypothetical protein
MGRYPSGNEPHFVESERVEGRTCNVEMATVNGIERTSQ